MAKWDLRQLAALALVLVLLGGALLLGLPPGAAEEAAVRAFVVDENTLNILPGAKVTLLEAHGDFALGPVQADTQGVATFHPPVGTYQFAFNLTGYYNGNTSFFVYNGTGILDQLVKMRPFGPRNLRLQVKTEPLATVTVVERASRQVVASKAANATGSAAFDLWSTAFSVMINKTGRETWVAASVTPPYNLTTPSQLNDSFRVFGWVRDANNNLITSGVSAFLFDEDTSRPLPGRLIVANVSGSYIVFDAPRRPANYTLIVAAPGYAPNVGHHIAISGSMQLSLANVTLRRAPETTVRTAIVFRDGDWSGFALTRSVTVSPGGALEGLPYAWVRDAQLQLALNYGGDHPTYNAGTAEQNALRNRLLRAGPNNLTTASFLSINDFTYTNVTGTFRVLAVDTPPDGTVTYATAVNYTLASGSLPFDPTRSYFANLSVHLDNGPRLVNFTYTLRVPAGLDRSLVTATGVTVTGFTPIAIDPQAGAGYTRVAIVLKPSKVGTAYGRVVGPTDRFWEVNKDLASYKAIIPANVDVQFSAQDSTYPNAPDLKAFPDFNYTWRFDATNPTTENATTKYGFKATWNYSTPNEYTVKLVVRYPNNATSARLLTVDVDGVKPTVDLLVNGQATAAITVNQNDRVRFQATNYRDELWPGMASSIVRGYEWDFNGDGRTDATTATADWSYGNPGTFNATLRAVDGAGLKSDARVVAVTVRDTTRPTPSLVIRETQTGAEKTTLMEGVNYTFDASGSSDNFDAKENLTFAWTFGDGAQASGPTVYHTYAEYGSPKFSLAVRDRAGNAAYVNRTLVVSPDFDARPDLQVKDLRIDPRQPEESTFLSASTVRVSFNVTNAGGGPANAITITLVAFRRGEAAGPAVNVTNAVWRNLSGAATSASLAKGETKHVEFTWSPGAAGNWTLRVNVTDAREPPQRRADSTVTTQVEVLPAGWRTPALYGSIVAAIAGIPTALYVRRRLRARAAEGEEGEERLTRRRRAERRRGREEEGAEEEEEP